MRNKEICKVIVNKEITENNVNEVIKLAMKPKKPGFYSKGFVRILLGDGYGADTTGDTYFGAKVDLFLLAEIAAHNIKNKHFRSALTSLVQRLTKKSKIKGCTNVLTGQMKPGGMKVENAQMKIKDFAWSIIINVDSLLVVEKDGKRYLMLPVEEKTIEKYGQFIEIIDGQHRTLAFFYDVETLKKLCNSYIVHASVYVDGTEEEMTSVFDGLNFDSSSPSAAKKYHDRFVVGNLSYSEYIMYKVMERLAFSDEIFDADGFNHESCIANNIDFGLKEGNWNVQSIVQHFCCEKASKKERPNNVLNSVMEYGIVTDSDSEDEIVAVIADMLQVYMETCNLVHRQMFGGSGNMFQPKNPLSMKGSIGSVALGMFQACVEVAKEKDLSWTKENVATTVHILFNDIMHASFGNLKDENKEKHDKLVKGGLDAYDIRMEFTQSLVDTCARMSKKEFLQHKIVSNSRLGVRA